MATQTITINDANRYDLPVALQDLQTDNIQSIRMNAEGDLIIQFRDGMELIIDDYDANANMQQAVEVMLSDGSIMSLDAMQAYMDMQGFDVAGLAAARLNNIQTAAGPLGATQQNIDAPEQDQEIATLDEVELEAVIETDVVTAQSGIAQLSDDMLFFADATNAPASILEGLTATAATGGEDVALADIEPAAGEDLAAIEPAAGDAAGAIAGGGGLGFNSSVDQTSALDIFAVGPVGPTALQFGLPDPDDQDVNPDILNTSTPGTPLPIATAADQQVFEDNSIAPTINAQPSATDGSVQISVSISGIPSGVNVNTTSSGGVYNAGTGTWSITLPAGQGITTGPLLTPPTNSDVDLDNLTLSVTETELASGDTVTVTDGFEIVVDAVADTPTVSASNASGQELQSVPLNISTAVTDLDGSESISQISVSGLPSGATLNNGSFDSSAGAWILNTGDLTGLEINLPNGSEGTYTLNIVAQSVDTPTDSEITTANNTANASTTLTLTVADGETPIIGVTPTGNVDESSPAQPKTVSGTINVDYGNDTPGTITPNGNVTISGSVAGGSLTSGGVAVTTALSGNTVTGTAGGVTVFTLEVNPNTGGYTFSLFEPLDHADGSNPNDVISIEFDYVAQDTDGDTATGSVRIDVADDAPVAVNDIQVVADTQTTVSGNVTSNDDGGFDTNATVTNVSFGGTSVAVPATGTTTINGTYGTLTIAANGSYSYTKSTTTDNNDVFTYTLTDADGDSDTATLTLDLQDLIDPPVINGGDTAAVDESNVLTTSGNLNITYDAGGPGSVAGNASNSNYPAGLSSNGTAIAVTLTTVGGQSTYTGTAGGTTVFTFTLNSDGSYSYEQFEQIDHPDASNPDDALVLQFGFTATDTENETADGAVSITVNDDGPEAVNDSVSAEEGGNTATGNVLTNDDGGFDNPGVVSQVSLGGTTVTVPATGNVTLNGAYGSLTIAANGSYTYTTSSTNGTDNFVYTIRDTDGDTDTATLVATSTNDDQPVITSITGDLHADESSAATRTVSGQVNVDYGADSAGAFTTENGGFSASTTLTSLGAAVSVSVTGGQYVGTAGGRTIFTLDINSNGSFTFNQLDQIDHPNTTNMDEPIFLSFGVRAQDGDGDQTNGTIVIRVDDDGPQAVDDTDSASESGSAVMGNVLGNDDVGYDALPAIPQSGFGGTYGIVTQVSINGVTVNVPSSGIATIAGTYGTLSIESDGSYTYTPGNSGGGVDNFIYTLSDTDGDTDTANLRVTVSEDDDQPVVVNISTGSVTEGGNNTVNGTITVDYGNDGPGSITENGQFGPNGLTSLGVPISVSVVGGQYVGTAGGRTIFTMNIQGNGNYSFQQLDQIDHLGGNNNSLDLNFGFRATDQDGDTVNDTVTIRVIDDVPTAVDDTDSASETGSAVTGNVLSNDDAGYDEPGSVTQVRFNGSTVNVPSSGTAIINGTYGTLSIAANGSYTYTPANNGGGVDNFTYTLRDADGDTDTANLRVTVSEDDDQPVITSITGDQHADESTSAARIASGQVNVNYGNDGAGAFTTENGNFSSSVSLTSLGAPISVSVVGGQYVGTAGGRTIFTMNIRSDGSYTFALRDQIDHPNPNNHDEPIYLDFGIRAQDGDGDRTNGTLRIRVDDDGPQAVNDSDTVSGNGGTVRGGVLGNDSVGFDDIEGGAIVTQVRFGGTVVNVPASGFATISGAHGVLEINRLGGYEYRSTNNSGQTDVFEYTIRDADGDTDTATLSINQTPIVIPPVTNVTADITAPDFFEDATGYKSLDISAGYSGGNGNETMTLRITGIPNDWDIQSTDGFTFVNGGWEKTVSSNSYNSNGFRLRPSRDNSDDDGLIRLDVRVNDPDYSNKTATDTDRAIVDAVADNVDIDYNTIATANNHILWQSVPITSNFPDPRVPPQPYIKKISQIFGIDLRDTDGSESITSIEMTFTGSTAPLVVPTPGVYYPPISFSHGTATSLPIGSESLSLALGSASVAANYKIKYTFTLQEFMQAEIQSGFGPIRADLKVFSGETNLTDQETTFSNNTAVKTDSVMMTVGNISLSPLVLDLDGDGVELSNLGETETYFDLNGDGILEGTGWVRPDDGLLALDRNKDGIINDGTELFGDQGGEFANGFDSLARLDSNQDGQINNQDTEFADLVVWRDMNADGVSQADEMVSLTDLGIAGISLDTVEVWKVDGTNYISHEASFTYEDGSEGLIVDAWFKSIGIDEGQGADIYAEYEQAQEDAIAEAAMLSDQNADAQLSQLIEMLQSNDITSVDFAEGDMIDLSDLVGTQTDLDQAIEAFVVSSDTGESVTVQTAQTSLGEGLNMTELAAVDLEQLFTTTQSNTAET